ncbi:MAG TPA: L-histidine N(alpha)-methyltransferase [Kofleriaceae bacterium]|nr:L-histidine N(alpha)-methyltransferase [Kofleriaceae bacterium]
MNALMPAAALSLLSPNGFPDDVVVDVPDGVRDRVPGDVPDDVIDDVPDDVPDDVIDGLCAERKHLPCRLLYDDLGAALFDQICGVEEYYPTRAELALLGDHLPHLAATVGARARILEPGSGTGHKTRLLLSAMQAPACYVPIDVSATQLADNAESLRREFPELEVLPVCGDYLAPLRLPTPARSFDATLVFFPGSTIGNFHPDEACTFLARLADLAEPGGWLLLGADANTDEDSLLRAYDDEAGVTAAFNLNVLSHLNRSHAATFDPAAFLHRAVWNAAHSRVEMHLVSRRRQVVQVAGRAIGFERGEAIVTEHCYKHSAPALTAMLHRAGWSVKETYPDAQRRMTLWLARTTTR